MATEIAPPQADQYEGLSREDLLRAYRNMLTSRRIDDKEIQLKRQSRIFFQISGAGHEAVQTAIAFQMRKGLGLALPVLPRPSALPRPRREPAGHVPAGGRGRRRPGVRRATDALALGLRSSPHLHDLLGDGHRMPAGRRRGRSRPVSPARASVRRVRPPRRRPRRGGGRDRRRDDRRGLDVGRRILGGPERERASRSSPSSSSSKTTATRSPFPSK